MSRTSLTKIEAAGAEGFLIDAGTTIRVINTYGSQVVALWAFVPPDGAEHMSMEHTRIHAASSRPQPGTMFYTNQHTPILEMSADSSPRVHDWYLAACNQRRYDMLGHEGPHGSCADNLASVLDRFGYATGGEPCPLNLFENVSFMFGDAMEIKPPVAMPRDYVCFRAQIPCLVVLSSCPQDILPTNGPDLVPKSVEVEVYTPA